MRLLYAALAWCAGILIAAALADRTLPAALPTGFALWSLLSGIAGALVCWCWHDPRLRRPTALLLIAALGGLRYSVLPAPPPLTAFNNRAGADLRGVLVSPIAEREDGRWQFIIETIAINAGGDWQPIHGRALVQADPVFPAPAYGAAITVHGSPRTPPRFDDFDYSLFLSRENVYTYINDGLILTVEPPARPDPLLTFKARLRDTIQTILPDPAAGLLRGILLGDDALPRSLQDAFAAAGTAHVIAVSGFNLAVVGGTVTALLRWAGLGRRGTTIGALLAITLYAVLVGLTGGVFRAWVMTAAVITAGLMRRPTYAPASLALAVILLTLIDPRDLADVSFQLSAAAVLGLAAFTQPIRRVLENGFGAALPRSINRSVGGLLAETTATALAAFVVVAPLIALYFGRLSLVALPANLLIAAVQPIILLVGAAGVLIGLLIPVIGQAVLLLTLPALAWTLAITRGFAALPLAEIAAPISERVVIVGCAALIGGMMVTAARPHWFTRLTAALTHRTLQVTAGLAALGLLALIAGLLASRPDGRLHVWALDMDGRAAVLIQTPGGAHILIDGGLSPRRLLTALGDRLPWNKRTLDLVVLTTPSEWEIRGLADVLPYYPARAAWTSAAPVDSDAAQAVYAQLPAAQTVRVHAGYSAVLSDGVTIEVLYPSAAADFTPDPADTALVLALHYGDVRFLITGTLSGTGQRELIASGADLAAAVLHIPTSREGLLPELAAAAHPSAAFLTARRTDSEPLAIAEVSLAAADRATIPLLSTGTSGDLHWWTDGARLWYSQP